MIFLPGTDKQFKFLLELYSPRDKNILIAGSQTESIGFKFLKNEAAKVQIITEDSGDLMDLRLSTKGRIPVKMMDFSDTDFRDGSFDLIYSQASFSSNKRRKIYKEALRILKDDGIICSGEIISSAEEVPVFMKDIWNSSGLLPLTMEVSLRFFNEAGLEIIEHRDLSFTLKEFYNAGRMSLNEFKEQYSEDEIRYLKKLLNKISHESNAYLKLGGDRYMEFHAFILKRKI